VLSQSDRGCPGPAARSLELRAVVSLSRLAGEQGGQPDLPHTLADVYDWFTEGFDTADLREAKALLARP
jgi:predicted ATPase